MQAPLVWPRQTSGMVSPVQDKKSEIFAPPRTGVEGGKDGATFEDKPLLPTLRSYPPSQPCPAPRPLPHA